MNNQFCKQCFYAVKDFNAGTNNYFCKYNPPTPVAIPTPAGVHSFAIWPVVTDRDFCHNFLDKTTFETVSTGYLKLRTDQD